MQFTEIIATIERHANPAWQASWDKSGLQVATRRTEFFKMAVCLDPLPHIIAKALENGSDFILAHHPLSLKPSLPNKIDNWYEALQQLLCVNVPLYSAHTSLDVNMRGPAGWLGRVLGLHDCKPLEAIDGLDLGYGVVGTLPEPMRPAKFLERIQELLSLDWFTLCGDCSMPESISRIAYCGGSGASLLTHAQKSGAQLYLTGDVKYHSALDTRIIMVDIGHHSLEEKMMQEFAKILQRECKNLDVHFYPSHSPYRLITDANQSIATPK